MAELFRRYHAHGDLDALGRVFDGLAPRLLRVALHLCANPADAEDLVQQTFVLAMNRAATFDPSLRLEPWLAGLLGNVARNAGRSARRRHVEALPELASTDEGPLVAAERAELVARIRTQVQALPRKQRQVLLLQLHHGLSPAEIAEVLEVPPGTVRMRLHRGLAALRHLLPVGLGALAACFVPARGLAAVRHSVLQTAKQQAAASHAATLVAGGMLVKKLALLIGAVVLVCLWAMLGSSDGGQAAETAAKTDLPAARGDAPTLAAQAEADAGGSARRVEERSPRGSLRVRVLAKISGSATRHTPSQTIPVRDAFVQAWRGPSAFMPLDGSELRASTDAHGELVLADLTAGPYHAHLAADRELNPVAAVVEAGRETTLELVVQASRSVDGIVVDATGEPVAAAAIWVHCATGMRPFDLVDPWCIEARRAAVTDEQGRFRIAIWPREDRIAASKPGHGASFGRSPDDPGELRLVLGRDHATVAGTVRDSADQPAGNAYVKVTPAGQDYRREADGTLLASRVPQIVRTAADGTFRFDGLPPGRHKLTAWTDPGMPTWTDVEVAASGQAHVDLKLPDGITVIGTVRRADGTPAAGLFMAARPRLDANGHYSHCGTRPDGTYRLPYVAVRRLFVTINLGHHGNAFLAHREFAAPEPGVLRCDFDLPELLALRGRVVGEDGRGLERWHVAAEAAGRTTWCTTSAGGSFEVSVVVAPPSAGARRIVAYPKGGDPRQPAAVLGGFALPSEPIELRVPAAAMPMAFVRGRLIDATGKPLAERQARLDLPSGGEVLATLSARDGSFEIGPCAAGSFALLVGPGSSARRLAEVTLGAGEQREIGDLLVPALSKLSIEVLRGDGSTWTATMPWFEVIDAKGTRIDATQVATARGRDIELEPGRYRVAPRGPDILGEPQDIDIVAGKQHELRCRVTIGRSRTLVFNGDGRHQLASREALQVVVKTRDGTTVVEKSVTNQMPDLRGFRYWYLDHCFALGTYRVEARSDSGLRYAATVEVRGTLDDPTRVGVPLASR